MELPRVRYSLLLVNLYLRPGVGLTGDPNPLILARLAPLLKQGANWVVVGDWNFPSQELEDTSLPSTLQGKVVAPEEATISTGNCLDFALASRRVAPLLQCSVNWSVPFRPHAAVVFRLAISGGQVPLPQLPAFEGSLRSSTAGGSAPGPAHTDEGPPPSLAIAGLFGPEVELGRFGRTQLHSSPANLRFAHLTSKVRYFTKPGGRGCARPIVHRPLMQPKAGLPWYGQEAAWWQKLLQAWEPPPGGPCLPVCDPPIQLPGPGVCHPHPGPVVGWGTPPRMTSFARPHRMPLSLSKSEPLSRKVAARQ